MQRLGYTPYRKKPTKTYTHANNMFNLSSKTVIWDVEIEKETSSHKNRITVL
jgi:hypothetical protein